VRRGFFPLKLDWIKDGAGAFMGDRGGVGCVGFGLGYVHSWFPFLVTTASTADESTTYENVNKDGRFFPVFLARYQ
jgi:hypothetical protein